MATELKQKQSGKHDAFIEAQLAKAENRIRLIDLCSALLGLLAGALAFAVVMVLLDRRFVFSDGTRQFVLFFSLAAAAVYLAFTVIRPLRWRVNPYYAARQLEQTLPGSRNHVINWIDLHGEKVPSVLKSTLAGRAAKDLSKADVDRAISNRRAISVGATAGFFALIFIVLFFLFGPRPFASLLGRAFAPFGGTIASRTQVDVIRPQDTTVTIGNPITIVARVGGRVPDVRDKDAPRLLYRHEEGEAYRERFLQPDESNQEWAATIGPQDVGNGFFYKVAAGDAESKEYRVQVRAAPLLSKFLARYEYRPYTKKADHTRESRKLEDLRGTKVHIRATANRAVKEGRLDFEGADGVGDLIRAESDPKDPHALIFNLVLDRAGKYRIRFTSTDNEAYLDSNPYEVLVLPDLPPEVRLTEPAKDVTLPANGHLELKGDASDDFGIARLTLHLQIVGGGKLAPKPYMADKLGTPNYGTPRLLEYRDLLELTSLKDAQGKPAELTPGMVIEYWLEATDACDYPAPNVTASKPRYKITIAEAKKEDTKQQKEREAARNRQKEHEQQQQEQMKKEKEARDKEKEKEQQQEKDAERQREQKDKEKEAREKDKEKSPDRKDEPKPGDSKKDKETGKKADEIKEKLDKKDQEKSKDKGDKENKRGEGRGEDNKTGKGKDGEKKPGEDKEGKENKPGESRGDGGQDGKNPAGEKKEGGKPGEQGTGRSEGKSEKAEPKGEGKQGSEKGDTGNQPGQGKEGAQPKPSPGQGKDSGKGEGGKEAGERKPQSDPKPGDRIRQGEARDSRTEGKPTDLKPNEGKDGARPSSEGPKSQGKDKGEKTGVGKPSDGPKGKGAGKDKPTARSADPGAKPGEKKEDGRDKGRPRAEDAKPADVKDREKDLKSPNVRTRGQAKRDLEDIKNKANDEKAREAARQALDEAKKDEQPGQDKPAPGAGAEKGEKKPGEGPDGEAPGAGKGGDPMKDPTEGGNGKGGAPKKGDGTPEKGEGPGRGKDRGDHSSDTPGEGMAGDRSRGGNGGTGEDKRPKGEKPAAHRASMMQLEEFRKKVDKDVLKDLKMSREQFEKFLRDYADLAKRQQKTAAEAPEVLPGPQRGGALPSVGGTRSKPAAGSKTDDVRSEGRPQPPPEYRDKYADFLRRLATPPK
jgi:hypothetical protein